MMNALTHDRVDRLEQRLVADGRTVDDLCAAYSVYLLSLLSRGVLAVASHAHEAIFTSLSYSATFASGAAIKSEKQERRRQMTAIELSSKSTCEATSVFAKCAGHCLYDQSDWDANNDGSDTPLFYYLYHLEPVIAEAADDFFAFFHQHFNLAEYA